jgi:putative transposase
MPRSARLRIPGLPLHLLHRGNNRVACFFQNADYGRYLQRLQESAQRFDCRIHAYVLMTNHVHLLVSPGEPEAVSWFMKRVEQDHAQYMNRTYGRTGSLWENRYYSSFVDSDLYLLRCHRYIELNPVRASMVRHPAEYTWSSFRANALGYPNPLLTPHGVYEALGSTAQRQQTAYRQLFEIPMHEHEVDAIRAATRGGRTIGSMDLVRGTVP